jgi:prolyl-tRNA synthetase
MELIGIPHRVVIGDRALAEGNVEYKRRSDEEPRLIAREGMLDLLLAQMR